jgi:tetratricopeptide (TPR) repeat protein
MSVWLFVLLGALLLIGWLMAYMLAQKPATSAQQLIHQHRYADAVNEARNPLDRAEALKLLGRFEEAIAAYRQSNDPAAREGIALSLAHLGRDLDDARRLMDEQIAQFPQIQEFQALALAYILLKAGDRDAALRLYRDNVELLETRFRDDYTDRDPLLAETVWLFAQLADANGEHAKADVLRVQAREWAPGSVWQSDRLTVAQSHSGGAVR